MRGPLAHRRMGIDEEVGALAAAGTHRHQRAKLGCRADQYVRPATADVERPAFLGLNGWFGSRLCKNTARNEASATPTA